MTAPAPKPVVAIPLMDKVGVYYKEKSRTCIVFSFGRKYIHAIPFDNPITCVELPRDEQLRPVLMKGLPYPIKAACERMLAAGFPITDRAAAVLRNLCNNEEVTVPEAV